MCVDPLGQSVEALGEVIVGLKTSSASAEMGEALAVRRRDARLSRVVGNSIIDGIRRELVGVRTRMRMRMSFGGREMVLFIRLAHTDG